MSARAGEGGEGRANVVALELEPVEPLDLQSAFQLRPGAIGELQRPPDGAKAKRTGLSALLEPFGRVLANRLEHEEPSVRRLP